MPPTATSTSTGACWSNSRQTEAVPRIQADSVAEHVARQEAAVFDAALRLFVERGYAGVSLGDIAAEVGLARNSLYRYFPDKAHILLRWFRAELPAQVERAAAVLGGKGTPRARIEAWVADQLDYARQPEHDLIVALAEAAGDLEPAERAELADSHRQVLAPLDAALVEAGVADAAERGAVADLIGGLVIAAGQREARLGAADPEVRAQVGRALGGLLAGGGAG